MIIVHNEVTAINFLIFEDDEPQVIWDAINKLQLVLHPRYAPEGKIEFHGFWQLCHEKNLILLLDRNLLSSLLSLCEKGFLDNEREMRIVALLMVWTQMNDISISAGIAITENASKLTDSNLAKIELQMFNEIFEFYPSMIWLKLTLGEIDEIPPCQFSRIPYDTAIAYHKENDHLLMSLACMLHIVYLYRQKNLSAVDKVIAFLKWNCENLLISQYTNTYITMLFSNQEYIKPPKGVNSGNFETIWKGCYNQAWDISYLSNWSTVYCDESKTNEVFLFATADVMLKRIFINTHGNEYGDLVSAAFPKKQAKQVLDFCVDNIVNNRVKPNFGNNPQEYFRNLIEREKQRVMDILPE